MSNSSGRLFWLTIDGRTAGPFSIAQIHEKLASGQIQWQTPACEVGGDHWLPIVQQPHFGPPRKTQDSSVRATPPPISRRVESNPQSSPSRDRSVHSGSGLYPALKNLFVGLVTADIVMTVMSFVLFIVGLNIEPVDEFAVNNGPSPADGLLCIGVVILLPTMIVAWVGMFRFANWGRWTYAGVVCASHLFSLGTSLFDFSAHWQLLDAFSSIQSTLGGLLLGIAFYSPLVSIFRASAGQKATNHAEPTDWDRTPA